MHHSVHYNVRLTFLQLTARASRVGLPAVGLRDGEQRRVHAEGAAGLMPAKRLLRMESGTRPLTGNPEPMATCPAHTASPPPPSRTPAGSPASSRPASTAPRTTSARGPPASAARRTRTRRSTPAPPTPVGASRLQPTVRYPAPASAPERLLPDPHARAPRSNRPVPGCLTRRTSSPRR